MSNYQKEICDHVKSKCQQNGFTEAGVHLYGHDFYHQDVESPFRRYYSRKMEPPKFIEPVPVTFDKYRIDWDSLTLHDVERSPGLLALMHKQIEREVQEGIYNWVCYMRQCRIENGWSLEMKDDAKFVSVKQYADGECVGLCYLGAHTGRWSS